MDEDDRLVQVSKGIYASGAVLVNEFTVSYSYDSMGRMLRRDNGSEVTTFVWDGWDLLSETTDSVTTTYLVPDGLVWSFVRGEDVFQVHTDALGSVRVVTDSEGEVVARFEYGAWGELLPGSFDSVGLALRFVGGLGVRTDLEAGLLYMRHRWYGPSLQRFISREPIGAIPSLVTNPLAALKEDIGQEPQLNGIFEDAAGRRQEISYSGNLYTYADNRPLNLVEPTGLSAVCVGVIWNPLEYFAGYNNFMENALKSHGQVRTTTCHWIFGTICKAFVESPTFACCPEWVLDEARRTCARQLEDCLKGNKMGRLRRGNFNLTPTFPRPN